MFNEHKKSWLGQQDKTIYGLEGQQFKSVVGLLEALDWADEEETKPIFSHPALKFKQFSTIFIVTKTGRTFRIVTSQDDDVFGLALENFDGELPLDSEENYMDLSQFFQGSIRSVSRKIEHHNISEICIESSNRTSILVPGEVEPGIGEVLVRKMDESILMFDCWENYENTTFGQSIQVNLRSYQNP